MDVIKELEDLKEGHYYCEDAWYSCPLADGGCANDSIPKNKCNCGAEDQHKRVDAIIDYLSNNGFKPVQVKQI